MNAPGQPNPPRHPSRNDIKWTPALTRAGWTAIPNIIFERQQALGLDPLDINILLHIVSYWWEPENKPHPSMARIADAIGVDRRTVQRHIARLEKGRLIRREQRRTSPTGSKTNVYHLDGLIVAATPYAHEKLADIKIQQAAKAARARRKGPAKLFVVTGGQT
jgi:DNA-binding transcriptional ArsR family regulator